MTAAQGPVMELVISAEGRYVEANEPLLDALGYTLEELRSLRVGALSTADATAAEEVWRRYVAGEIDIPANRTGVIRAKDGRQFDVVFLGLNRRSDDEWELRMQFVGERPSKGSRTLQYVLADWRAVERRLAETPADDPSRPYLETLAAELRAQYRREANVRDQGPDEA